MPSKDLTWNLFGKDVTASKAFQDLADEVRRSTESANTNLDGTNKRFKTFGDELQNTVDHAGSSLPTVPPMFLAIAAAATLVGPATAVAAGGIIGVSAAAGTAFLAFEGLKTQMQQATPIGQALTAQFAGLSATINKLETTAAKEIAPGVIAALQDMNKFLPTLNPLVGDLSSNLGDAAHSLTGALVSGLQTASPLIHDFGIYISDGAKSLENFAGSQKFADFIAYAQQELPKVGDLIGKTVTAVVELGTAIQPAGDAIIGQLDDIASAIDAIHLDKLAAGFNAVSGGAGSLSTAVGLVISPLSTLYDTIAGGNKTVWDASGSTKDWGDASVAASMQLDKETASMVAANDAAGLLKQAFDALNGTTLDVNDANVAFHASMLSVTAALKENGTTMDLNTQAGVDNNKAVSDAIHKAEAHAEAISGGTKLTAAGTAAYRADLVALQAHIKSVGGNTTAIDQMINTMKHVPPVTKSTIEVATDKANANIAAIKRAIAGIPSKNVPLFVYANPGSLASAEAAIDAVARYREVTINTINKVAAGGAGGGQAHASGGYLDPGWNRVGEQGPELVYNTGSNNRVHTASETRGMGGGDTYNLHFNVGYVATPIQFQDQVAAALEQKVGRGGTVTIAKGVR